MSQTSHWANSTSVLSEMSGPLYVSFLILIHLFLVNNRLTGPQSAKLSTAPSPTSKSQKSNKQRFLGTLGNLVLWMTVIGFNMILLYKDIILQGALNSTFSNPVQASMGQPVIGYWHFPGPIAMIWGKENNCKITEENTMDRSPQGSLLSSTTERD